MAPPISVVILTQDEEVNLPGCLDSLQALEDVHVLDSGSTDRTISIARDRNVPVHHHPFTGFGQQRNWAIDHVPTKHPWQFHLDADERFTPELIGEIADVLKDSPAAGGYFVPSKLIFAGKWLRYAGCYPTYQVRLFHRERLRFVDYGHGQREQTSHPLGRLTQPYLHLAFSKGLDHWFAKHAVYARREANQLWNGTELEKRSAIRGLFSRDRTQRRRALKRLTARLPLRYLFRFAYLLLVRWAFLDGSAGITYAHLIATYEAMVHVHLRLLQKDFRVEASREAED